MVVHVKSDPQNPSPTPFDREAFRRTPLAASFFQLWAYIANDVVLKDIFEDFRGRCYEDRLLFSELVGVLLDALTRCKGSARKAIHLAQKNRQLSSKARAVYGKLARLPLPLAEAFLSFLTSQLRSVFPLRFYHTRTPLSLCDLRVVVLDGKKIKDAAKRLLPCRETAGGLYGGKILAAYLPEDGTVVAMAADPDGETNDIPLVPRVLQLTRQAVSGPCLFVADAQFCDLDQPTLFCQDDGHFLVRFTVRNSFTLDPQRAARTSKNQLGQTYTQEWGWMGLEKDPRRIYLRRITLERKGEEDIALVTDLLDETEYLAEDLLKTYLTRWQIENVFQQITEVFGLKQLIGSAPGATVFQASMCLVIYNMLQVLRAWIKEGRPQTQEVDDISSENIFESLTEDFTALDRMVGKALLALVCQGAILTLDQVRDQMKSLLVGLWEERWLKARNRKRRSHQPDKPKKSGAHTSVHKVLQKAKLASAQPAAIPA